ncbi:putative leucine-rich repeat receptor-like protein kinase [Vitis vinifera]|uniref:non-specific serine/threonine protein kinase n=1 Tax=Vitis vinifera TaxID=29760 RepID=A0A438EW88_VITVI|nr:putative leucine-rich repeat receptor-like protein kinase [Vitis vinifera]
MREKENWKEKWKERKSKAPSLGELDAADDGEGDEAIEEGHEIGGAEDEEGGGSGETRDNDLGEGEEGVRDGDDSDGLHGLDRHWDAEEKADGDVVESREDEGCGEVQVVDQCERAEPPPAGADERGGGGGGGRWKFTEDMGNGDNTPVAFRKTKYYKQRLRKFMQLELGEKVQFQDNWKWNLVMEMEQTMDIFLVLFGCLALVMLVHGKTQPSFISIDCGLAPGSEYTDIETQISYSSDAEYIDTGRNYNVSEEITSRYNLKKHFMNVRSFPEGARNCYTLRPEQEKDNKYLIRALFMYGNYDSKNQFPEFKLYLVLELRPLNNSIYDKTEPGSLLFYNRWDFGAEQDMEIRDKDDVFDRIWNPFRLDSWEFITASYGSYTLSTSEYRLPRTVMATAATPANESESLRLSLNISGDPSQKLYMYMHFAEVEKLNEGELREFTISLNDDESWGGGALTPPYLSSDTLYSTNSVSGSTTNKLLFTIKKTGRSTRPPIINAMEVYKIKDFSQSSTLQGDVDAIKKIKSVYTMSRNWQGDPCLPESYRWTGLSCSKSGSPSIISLDLSYNNLTGEIPDFLAELTSLNSLNLSGNNFTGSVPLALLRKSDEESLSLSLDGNPYLCKTNSCAEEEEKQKKKGRNITVPVVASVASIASVLLLLAALATLWRFKIRRQHGTDGKPKEEKKLLDSKNQCFSYSEVVSITDNFQKVLGKGGFGAVYSGHLKDGTQVAVKMLSPSSAQGYISLNLDIFGCSSEQQAQLLARVHHRNLASLVGYCDEGSNMGLIYEYMANGNLEELLSGKNAPVLSWEQRLRIAIDAAQALEYLHNGCKPPIIHRDVKTANILLNEKLQAKVGDFGMSRIIPFESETHVSTAVVGTPGYLDPEYYITARLNEKSDVYSFGIVLLELISGKPAIIGSHGNKDHIVQWVSPIISRGEIRSIVDPRLEGDLINTNSAWKAVETAMACVPSISIQRPTMSEVVGELKECLNIEIRDERAYNVKEDNGIISSYSPEMVVLGIDEDAMGPQAR